MTRFSRNRSPSTARIKKNLKDAEEPRKKKSMSILTTAPIHTKIDIQVFIFVVQISYVKFNFRFYFNATHYLNLKKANCVSLSVCVGLLNVASGIDHSWKRILLESMIS